MPSEVLCNVCSMTWLNGVWRGCKQLCIGCEFDVLLFVMLSVMLLWCLVAEHSNVISILISSEFLKMETLVSVVRGDNVLGNVVSVLWAGWPLGCSGHFKEHDAWWLFHHLCCSSGKLCTAQTSANETQYFQERLGESWLLYVLVANYL